MKILSLPLVSILIPTYNRPKYFKQALRSAIFQEYPNIEIIVCDDSTDDKTYLITMAFKNSFPHIRYYRNTKNLGGVKNFQKALQHAKGEYINFLMDDDLFHPQKISKMIQHFLLDQEQKIKLVTAHRQPIDEDGKILMDFQFTKKKFSSITILDGIEAGDSMILELNWIGEPTTPLFRKKDLIEPFGMFNGFQFRASVDMASWLTLLSQGHVLYIPTTLSYLRMHNHNIGKSKNMQYNAAHDWFHLLYFSTSQKFLRQPKKLLRAAKDCLRYLSYLYKGSEKKNWNKINILQFYIVCLIKHINELTQIVKGSE